jgi:hypothetical protein
MLLHNVLRSRAHWAEKNELTPEQADEVFEGLLPEGLGKDGQPEYGELAVDLAIQAMRLKGQREAVEKKAAEGSPVYQTLLMLLEGRRESREQTGGRHGLVGVDYVAKKLGISRGTAKNRARLSLKDGGFPPRLLAGKTSERGHHRFHKAEVDSYAADQGRPSADSSGRDPLQPASGSYRN